jgi:Na+:H+ antiporter
VNRGSNEERPLLLDSPVGLVLLQVLPDLLGGTQASVATAVRLLTMVCLSFVMIHVGYEFDLERGRLRSYAADYRVAATAVAFPWIFRALYFVVVRSPPSAWASSTAGKRRCWPAASLP